MESQWTGSLPLPDRRRRDVDRPARCGGLSVSIHRINWRVRLTSQSQFGRYRLSNIGTCKHFPLYKVIIAKVNSLGHFL